VADPGTPLDGPPGPTLADRAVGSARGILAIRLVSLAIVFVGSILLARSLGPDNRGAQGVFVAATILLGAIFGGSASIGAYVLATRHGAEFDALNANATWFGLIAGLLSMGTAIAIEWLFGALPAPLVALPLWPLAVLVAVAGFVINTHEIQLAFAKGRPVAGAAYSYAPYTLAAFGYAAALVVAPGNLTVTVWIFALAPAITSLVARRLNGGLGARLARPESPLFRSSLRQGLLSYAGELAALLHQRLDVILLGAISGTTAVGIYVVGYQAVEPILALSAASAAATLALGHGNPAVERGEVTVRLVRQTALLGALAALAAIALAPILIPAIYGADFEAAVAPLRIIVPGVVGLAIGRIGMADLLRRNMLGRMTAISSAALVINVTLNLVLIPRLGAIGAASASLVSYWAFAGMSLVTVRHESGFPWSQLVPRPRDFIPALRR
jgi:O-antigen/teichoic acid export membrane protein